MNDTTPRHYHTLSDEEKTAVHADLRAEVPFKEIAAKYNVLYSGVMNQHYRMRRKLGLKPKKGQAAKNGETAPDFSLTVSGIKVSLHFHGEKLNVSHTEVNQKDIILHLSTP